MFANADTLLKATSWTLVHSIWQGFILAFLAGIVIMSTKKATAALRYNLLSGLFLLFMVGIGLTFNFEYLNEGGAPIATLNAFWEVENGRVAYNLSGMISEFLNRHAATIVLMWFVIFCYKCLAIVSNLGQIYRIRNYRNHPVSAYWQEQLEVLGQKINIQKSVVLLESQLVKVPSVTGIFKPIILLPIGLLSQLPQDQVEAILLHELAHIRRKDYFVNMLQSFAEIIFFFNPGVLWLSSLIKEERENCCDDIAVSVTKCRTKFVQALVSFQEYNMKTNGLVMGFGSKENQLLNRAKRIIHNDTKSLNAVERTFLSIAFVAVLLIMIANSHATLSNVLIPFSFKNKEIVAEKIQKSDIEIEDPIETNENSLAQTIVSEPVNQTKNQDCDKEVIFSEEETELREAIVEKQYENSESGKSSIKVEEKKECRTIDQKRVVAATNNTIQTKEVITLRADKVWNSPEKMSEAIIVDLKIDRIISGQDNLSYSLSDTKFIVNGIVQADTVHKKFKQKYLSLAQQKYPVSDNISICYNFDISNLVACN